MPRFLEDLLKKEYPSEPAAPYKIMNAIGAMKGNKETPKGKAMAVKHAAKAGHPHTNLGKFLHPKKGK